MLSGRSQGLGARWARGSLGSGLAGLGARWARGSLGSGLAGLGARWARGSLGSGLAGLGARWARGSRGSLGSGLAGLRRSLSSLPEGGQRREPPPYPVNGARMRKVDRVGGRLGSNGRGCSAVGRLLRSRVPGTALLMPQGGMSSQSVASATALNTSDAHPLCGGQPGPAVFRSILWSNGCC